MAGKREGRTGRGSKERGSKGRGSTGRERAGRKSAPPGIISVSRVIWRPSWRIVPSRFPPIGLFDRVANPADLEAVFALEAMTNDRLRDEAGELSLVAPEDRISGPGSTAVMAAFTHLNPEGSRFSDGTWGVYYAGDRLETAIAETRHHRARFLAATSQPRIEIDMRVYQADIDAGLHDLRGRAGEMPDVYDPADYGGGQRLARRLRDGGSAGVVYDSVRLAGAACVAVFRPKAIGPARQERHLCYIWNGKAIEQVYEKRALEGA